MNEIAEKRWHNLRRDEVLKILDSRPSGLSETEARARLRQYGLNQLAGKKKVPPVIVFLRQFLSPLIYVLLAATAISFAMDHFIDAIVILVVLLLNAVIGFVQETRAEKAMEALIQMAAPRANVQRNGRVEVLPARQVVPGDILLLETGEKVPADARLIEVSNLKVNEATLTGESMPVEKTTGPLGENVPVAERKNLVYMGTIITYGRARAVVVNTGMTTEIGRIASAIQEVKPEKTPLQKSIGKLSQYLVVLFLGVCGLLVAVGLLKGLEWLDVFLLAVAAAVSAIPEGLPAVVTIVLAIGMRVMARRNAVIRKLVAVETLGSATVICSDKTGTLTVNEMTVNRVYTDSQWVEVSGEGYQPQGEFRRDDQVLDPKDERPLGLLLRIGALCNDALLVEDEDENSKIFGDPTEGALVVAAAKAGLDKERMEKSFPRLDEIPFQSEKQYMATMHPRDGGRVVYVKGAVEKLLPLSSHFLNKDGPVPLTEGDVQAITGANEAMAGEAMRVMATAYADLPEGVDDLRDEHIRGNLVFVGLMGMSDPPREEAKEAVQLCRQAGIKVVMITGDNQVTAESVARQLELPPGETVRGVELQEMSDEELSRRVESISVFARIEPLHKLRIVNALKEKGHIVAMTGDGVNDAPALKTADIGVAMGITGTDVAKEASDMVLADDNFASVVAAVEEGRAIYNRLRNVLFFFLGTNLGELLALILSVLIVGQAPLLAVQILWVNLVTDTAGGIPLGFEPKSNNELKQHPRHPKVGLVYPGLLLRVGYLTVLMGVGTYAVFNWAQARTTLEEARTIAFCTMVVFQWFQAFNARSDESTVLQLGFFRNRWLIVSIAIAAILQVAVVYVPFLQTAFRTVPLGIDMWGIALLAGGGLFVIEETRKALFPRLFNLGKWQPVSKRADHN
ncbi:MAG: HAD-IC family P-type ATPase [Dehalococcoidales bacterium]|nr:MAG: HAD-IC family P-type ATPase [Dehalococcoidales bacterium]